MRDQNLEPLNDALSHEIEQALAVEPSPEFHARVRARVSGSSPAAGVWWRWRLAGAGGIAVLLVLWLAIGGRDKGPGYVPGIESRPAPAAVVASAPQVGQTIREDHNRRESQAQDPRRTVPLAATPDRLRPQPEIVISLDEAAAFDRLLTTVALPDVVFVRGDELLRNPVQAQLPDPLGIAAIEVAPVEMSRTQEGEE